MIEKMQIVWLDPHDLKPYEKNARKHTGEDVGAIRASIREFGFNDPIGIWSDDNLIVEGHGRQLAAIEEGMEKVPCIRLDHLTDEQRRAYALAHNRTAENSDWDFGVLNLELAGIREIDMSEFGFENITEPDWFETRDRDDDSREDGNDEYNEFLDKFENPKTTDDCYTPDIVYDAVAGWVSERYGIDRSKFVRPFYPGGDYQKVKYNPDQIVVDNPPFSILSEIRDWYRENGVKYFLFAPAVSCFRAGDCAVAVGCNVTYENKAEVHTSFVTNMEPEYSAMCCPDLYEAVQKAANEYAEKFRANLPKYKFSDYVVTGAMMAKFAKYGQELKIPVKSSTIISTLDEMKEKKSSGIFGNGYLLSEKAAAEKAAAEKAAAEVWELSERELEIVRNLSEND